MTQGHISDGDDYHCMDCGESFDKSEVEVEGWYGIYMCPMCESTRILEPDWSEE